jgi:molybdopterin-binding protein
VELSARNQLKGTIVGIKLGEVMAEVTVDIGGGNRIVSAITRGSVEGLKLQEGQSVYAIIKSTEVLIGKD